jgi:HlyD family secretion protein/hemolysin D
MTMLSAITAIFTPDSTAVHEREFLPAALEILETPPSPLSRKTAYAICAVVAAGLGWATVGQVNIVAVASGKVVSHVRTQVVQPFETASVKSVLVGPGQHVKAGTPLIEMDATTAYAERAHARNDRVAASLDRIRLAAFLDGSAAAAFGPVTGATAEEVERAQSQLASQLAGRASQIAALAQERAQKVAERTVLTMTVAKLEKTLPMIAARAEIRSKAAAMGDSSVIAKLESQQSLAESTAELGMTKARIESLDAAVAELDQKKAATEAELRTNALGDLAKARDRAGTAEEALAKADRRIELQTLRSPIDGTVQQMHVVSVGSVVTPAQQMLSVVPDDDRIEVEAVLENRDIGFVVVGQKVELKVDAFPFTRYGLLAGKVTSMDRDAEAAPVGQGAVQGPQRPADETENVESSERLRYTVHIALDADTMVVDGRQAALVPGMSVKAEIMTGTRRIVDFLLAPLREHLHDAMRER